MSASLNPHKRNLLFAGDGDDPKDPRLHKGQRMRLYNAHSYTGHLLSEPLPTKAQGLCGRGVRARREKKELMATRK